MKQNQIRGWMTMRLLMVIGMAIGLVIGMTGLASADRALNLEKKGELMGTSYVIELADLDTEDAAGTDVLSFANGKLSLQSLLNDGYNPSNFTVTAQDDGTVTVETMQVHEDGQRAFLRGDLSGSVMTGRLTLKDSKGKTQSYTFKSQPLL